VESARICAELRGAGQFGALVATEHMARLFMGWHPPSSHQVRSMEPDLWFSAESCLHAEAQTDSAIK
jgi:hypothetical protein